MDPHEKLEMPNFEPDTIDLDQGTIDQMSPANRMMHQSYVSIRKDQSVRKQQITWLKDQIIRLHTIVGEYNEAKNKVVHLPYRIIGWLLLTGGAAALVKLIDIMFAIKKP